MAVGEYPYAAPGYYHWGPVWVDPRYCTPHFGHCPGCNCRPATSPTYTMPIFTVSANGEDQDV